MAEKLPRDRNQRGTQSQVIRAASSTVFNQISFRWQSLTVWPEHKGLVPFIDGRSLLDIVSAYELDRGYLSRRGKKVVGPVNGPLTGPGQPLASYFLGRMNLVDYTSWKKARPTPSARSKSARTAVIHVLGCNCGDDLCWPFGASITVDTKSVTWSNFTQVRRQKRDYSGIGPFVFARSAYDAAVQEISGSLPSEVP